MGMKTTGNLDRAAVRVAFGLVLAALVLTSMLIQGREITDDAYILYRYAENFGTGNGWVFNPGHPSDNAVTSTLTVLLLSVGRAVGISVPIFAAVIYFLASSGTAILAWLTLEKFNCRTAGVVWALLIATSPLLVSFWGMESSLYLLLLTLALYLAASRCPAWMTGLALGLIVPTRPDGVLVVLALVLVFFVLDKERRLTRRGWFEFAAAAAVPVVAYACFAYVTFGTVLPSTLSAKIAQVQSGYFHSFIPGVGIAMAGVFPYGQVGPGIFLFVIMMLAVVGLIAVKRGFAWQVALTLLVGSAAIAVVFGVLRVAAYSWYYVIPFVTLLMLGAMGVQAIVEAVAPRAKTPLLVAACILLAATGLLQVNTKVAPFRTDYAHVSDWLRENTPPESRIAAMELGFIGWYSNRSIIDYLGLLDHHADDFLWARDFTSWPRYYQPDYWVTRGDFIDTPFFESTCFKQTFRHVHQSGNIGVYQRIAPIQC